MRIDFTLADAMTAVEDASRLSELREFAGRCENFLRAECERAAKLSADQSPVDEYESFVEYLESVDLELSRWEDDDPYAAVSFFGNLLPDCMDVSFDPDGLRIMFLGRVGPATGSRGLDAMVAGFVPRYEFSGQCEPHLLAAAACGAAARKLLSAVIQ